MAVEIAHQETHGHGAPGHDHGGHGHLTLEYQPGLPMGNSKLIVWLFLSTEMMFFAGLIGTYIVLRFGAPVWPRTHDVHLSEPKGLLFLTLVLGGVFLGVKMYEYNAKFAHGIYPATPHSRIYERPDIYYASAVRERLNDAEVQAKLKELHALTPEKLSEDSKEAQRMADGLAEIDKINKIVQDPLTGPVPLALDVAQKIYPLEE